MKKLFLVILVLFTSLVYGQNNIAKFDTNFRIYLSSEENVIQEQYILDISKMSFDNIELKENFFNSLRGNLEYFELADEPNKVNLFINLSAVQKQNWTLLDWNEYFQKRAEKYLKNYIQLK